MIQIPASSEMLDSDENGASQCKFLIVINIIAGTATITIRMLNSIQTPFALITCKIYTVNICH